jgi:hypothetical protein
MALLIHKMLQAELNTATRTMPKTNLDWQRKSALPFVVAGIPAVLALCDRPSDRFRHIRRMYRFGIFIGGIDDMVDLRSDYVTGQINRHLKNWNAYPPSREEAMQAVQQILHEFKFLNAEWDKLVPFPGDRPLMQNMIEVCIISWFGGIKNPAYAGLQT